MNFMGLDFRTKFSYKNTHNEQGPMATRRTFFSGGTPENSRLGGLMV
jgi:hypothetical protein